MAGPGLESPLPGGGASGSRPAGDLRFRGDYRALLETAGPEACDLEAARDEAEPSLDSVLRDIRAWKIKESMAAYGVFLHEGGRRGVLDWLAGKYENGTWVDVRELVQSNANALEKEMRVKFAAAKDHYPPDDKEGREALHGFLHQTFFFGLLNFASVPVVYFLAFRGHMALYIYGFMVAKLLASAFLQHRMAREFQRWLQLHHYDALAGAVADYLQCSFFPSRENLIVVVAALASFWLWGFELGVALGETIDPDLDSLTAGGSWGHLSPEQNAEFARAWAPVPLLGPVMAYLGLPGALTATLAVAWFLQVCMLFSLHKETAARLSRTGLMDAFNRWCQMADVGGVLVVQRVMWKTWMKSKEILKRECPQNKEFAFVVKITVEVLPSAWLAISYLSLIYDEAPWAVKANVLASIASSFNVAISQVVLHIPFVRRRYQDGRCFHEGRTQLLFLCVGGTCLMCVVMAARLLGVFLCPGTHIFQASRLECLAA